MDKIIQHSKKIVVILEHVGKVIVIGCDVYDYLFTRNRTQEKEQKHG